MSRDHGRSLPVTSRAAITSSAGEDEAPSLAQVVPREVEERAALLPI